MFFCSYNLRTYIFIPITIHLSYLFDVPLFFVTFLLYLYFYMAFYNNLLNNEFTFLGHSLRISLLYFFFIYYIRFILNVLTYFIFLTLDCYLSNNIINKSYEYF